MQKYKNIDATLDMYIEYLDNLIGWYESHGKFDDVHNESFWDWNVAKEYIAQYKLMRTIFPEDKWDKKNKEEKYMIYSGSSFGRPWTEMKILKGKNHSVFWRIDTDNEGPYLSLRYYNWYDKKNEIEHNKHIAEYREYYKCAKEAASNLDYYNEIGKQENYYEATLLHIHIKGILAKWDENKECFAKEIRKITDDFIACVNNQK